MNGGESAAARLGDIQPRAMSNGVSTPPPTPVRPDTNPAPAPAPSAESNWGGRV
jgi:hypothetical protein